MDYVESLGEEEVLKIENNIYPIIKLGDAFELKTAVMRILQVYQC